MCVFVCVCVLSGDISGGQDLTRQRTRRMLNRDSSPDNFLCDAPGQHFIPKHKLLTKLFALAERRHSLVNSEVQDTLVLTFARSRFLRLCCSKDRASNLNMKNVKRHIRFHLITSQGSFTMWCCAVKFQIKGGNEFE